MVSVGRIELVVEASVVARRALRAERVVCSTRRWERTGGGRVQV